MCQQPGSSDHVLPTDSKRGTLIMDPTKPEPLPNPSEDNSSGQSARVQVGEYQQADHEAV